MPRQGLHAMLPLPTHDEAARENYVLAFRDAVDNTIPAAHRLVYEKRAAGTFTREHGHAPRNRQEIRRAMDRDSYGQMASSLRRLTQEVLWDTVSDSIERELPELVERARQARRRATCGSLELNPGTVIPRYVGAIDIHAMPGNYDEERMADDVFAGALYDRGVFLRNGGARGVYNERVGTQLADWLRTHHPGFKPRRLLDMGCAVGGTSVGLAAALPEIEVHAIELAAPMLRYAHARAESLGQRVHFAQRNAESTGWPDGHFDIVCSFALLHETSTTACRNILHESYRLLAPDGLMLHCDNPAWNRIDPVEAAYRDWGTHFNAEPFMGKFGDLDGDALMEEAGFQRDRLFEVWFPGAKVPASRFAARK